MNIELIDFSNKPSNIAASEILDELERRNYTTEYCSDINELQLTIVDIINATMFGNTTWTVDNGPEPANLDVSNGWEGDLQNQ